MGFSYNVNVLNQKGSPALYTDTFANRPAAGYAGRLFIANDTSAIYEDTGTAWVLIANVSSGAGTLQQVTTNGNTSNVGISITAGGLSTNSLTDTALTLGSVLFTGAAGLVTQDNAAFFWDDTNNRLGINTTTPGNSLDVHSSGTNPILALNNTAGNQSAIVFSNTGTNKWRIGNSASNNFDIINVPLGNNAISINTANSNVSFIESIKISQTSSIFATAGYNSILATTTGFGFQLGTSTINPTFAFNGLTASRNYVFPDAAGTIALTSDLSAYLPLAGGTMTGTLNGTSATFQSGTVLIGTLTDNLTGAKLQITGSTTNTGSITSYGNGSIFGSASNSGYPLTFQTNSVEQSAKFLGKNNNNNIQFFNDAGSTYQAVIGTISTLFYIGTGTSGVNRLSISSTGVTTISNLAGTGSRAVIADANGVLSAPVSDKTVKENIEPLKYGLNAIMKLNPISFDYINEYKNFGEGLQIGNIAQDVAKVIPEAVFTTPSTGLMGINYNQFDGIYIKAIQELNTIINNLLQRIELLENK